MKFKTLLAAGGSLLLAAGLMTLGVTSASATDSNHPAYWQTQPGEVCTDVGYQTDKSATHPYTLPAASEGLTYSKVIVKAGSNKGNSLPEGVDENTVYITGLTAGATFVHSTKGSISHVIVCTVPKVKTPPETPPTPPKPETVVVTGNWTDTAQDCDTRVVNQTRTVTTTTYTLVDHKWVGTNTVATENTTHNMTADELAVCAEGQPEAKVSTDTSATTDCDARTVTTTVTTTTVGYVLDTETNTWVKDKPVVAVKTTVLPATAEECPIPEVVAPPEEDVTPPTTPQAKVATPEVLAFTGAPQSAGWFALGAFGLLLLGAGTIVMGNRRKVTE